MSQLVQWKVIEKVEQRPKFVCRLFALPKSDANFARPILDCRVVNRMLNMDELDKPRFRLLPPLVAARVLLGRKESNILLSEVDFRSYFPSLRWSRNLSMIHGLRIRGEYYAHVAPSQGSALLPICAQALTLAIAHGPPPDAPWHAFHKRGIAVIYDNVAMSGSREHLDQRLQRLRERCTRAGIVIGDCQGPATEITSCGVQYQTEPARRFRLKPSWPPAARRVMDLPVKDEVDAARRAGLVGWMAAVLAVPLAYFTKTMHNMHDEFELRMAKRLLDENPWRELRGPQSFRFPDRVRVVVCDASVIGIGVVLDGVAYARPYAERRSSTLQQSAEFEAALEAVRLASKDPGDVDAILLIGDNRGVISAIARGLTCSTTGNEVIKEIYRVLPCPMWLAWVESEKNIADAPSRSSIPYERKCDAAASRTLLDLLPALKRDAREVLWTSVRPLQM